MSANLDLVRSIYAAWERGDFSSVAWANPDLVLVTADGPDPGRWGGLKAVSEAWRSYLRNWEELRTRADEYREVDGERVLVLAHNRGRGKTSGIDVAEMGWRFATVFRVRDGRVIELTLYFDSDRALADLGLEE
jgi:ketosteroid isomerase-like protein